MIICQFACYCSRPRLKLAPRLEFVHASACFLRRYQTLKHMTNNWLISTDRTNFETFAFNRCSACERHCPAIPGASSYLRLVCTAGACQHSHSVGMVVLPIGVSIAT